MYEIILYKLNNGDDNAVDGKLQYKWQVILHEQNVQNFDLTIVLVAPGLQISILTQISLSDTTWQAMTLWSTHTWSGEYFLV
jgi:hypothetical protein